MDPENRMLKQVNIDNAAEADYIFSMLMGEDVGPRRELSLIHILKNYSFRFLQHNCSLTLIR